MIEVEGDYCPYVLQRCLRWIDETTKLQCAEFAPTTPCFMATRHERFCIDTYEWPNKPGVKPDIGVSWNQAKDACEKAKKRLCLDSEWTLACEGKERLPYPYGYARNPEACNIDRAHPPPNDTAFYDPRTRAAEMARLDQRVPSGAAEACVSPFGVRDMAGNVDEWVVNERRRPHKGGLKGGYWGPVRDRCRPMTTEHEEKFSYYQTGFRCCADAATPVR
jgi:formylglycine-generating enzyme required for sulfatase activity